MFGGLHNRHMVERVYISTGRNMESTLDLFLTGNIPKEEDELHVIIEQKEERKQSSQITDTSYNQI